MSSDETSEVVTVDERTPSPIVRKRPRQSNLVTFERFEELLRKTENLSKELTEEDLKQLHRGNNEQFEKRAKRAQKYKTVATNGDNDNNKVSFKSTPNYIKNGQMRDYQIEGLNWMISLRMKGINGILADEMGLGKTLQTISLLGYMKHVKKSNLPHLVIVPLSTLLNWKNEFKRWCPSLNVVVFHCKKHEINSVMNSQILPLNYDVCLTTYEMVMKFPLRARLIDWCYLVVDEGHRLKNPYSRLTEMLNITKAKHRLLLTGTPIQNNVKELWALLHFIMPDVFNDCESFEMWFDTNQMSADIDIVKRLHTVTDPFYFRRIKADVEKSLLPKKEYKVYMGMTALQKKWYTDVLMKEIAKLRQNGAHVPCRLNEVICDLRLAASHPFLFSAAEPEGPPFVTDERIVKSSGKMMVLDKLLTKCKKEGSRVLLFSFFKLTLNLIEDYIIWKKYDYCRFDGDVEVELRQEYVDEFNRPDSKKFIFLMTTRSGGLGVNLATADVVILFDSDWNPQADIQAIDRSHRIGQTKQVRVFRLITENSVDEYILRRAQAKLRLDHAIIKDRDRIKTLTSTSELFMCIRDAANKVRTGALDTIESVNIDNLLKKSEEREEKENEELANIELMQEKAFLAVDEYHCKNKAFSYYTFEGEDYTRRQPSHVERFKTIDAGAIISGSRRSATESLMILEDEMSVKDLANRLGVHYEKQTGIINYRFYPQKYIEYCQMKIDLQKKINFYFGDTEDENEKIENSRELTKEEQEEMNELSKDCACQWSYLKFTAFIHGHGAVSRDNYKKLAEWISAPEEEVKAFSEKFWTHLESLPKHIRKHVSNILIEKEKTKIVKEVLEKKLEECTENEVLYTVPVPKLKKTPARPFTPEEDTIILKCAYEIMSHENAVTGANLKVSIGKLQGTHPKPNLLKESPSVLRERYVLLAASIYNEAKSTSE